MDRLRPRLDPKRTRRRARPLRAIAAATGAVALLLAGCGKARTPHPHLVDGSDAGRPPPAIRTSIGAAVRTRVRFVSLRQPPARWRGCLRSFAPELGRASRTIAVERTGVLGQSLSVFAPEQSFALACDRTGAPGEDERTWCGSAFGELEGISLRDPRLDILCRAGDGSDVAFAWINPRAGARWLLVQSGRRREVYDVVAGRPVRVTTTDVRIVSSSASFDVTQYDRRGKELGRTVLETSVAG